MQDILAELLPRDRTLVLLSMVTRRIPAARSALSSPAIGGFIRETTYSAQPEVDGA
jgi:hypothetical protein